jgi:serine/threonine protein kinase/tetratricopeptide (TPR) repeat protein
MAEHATPPSRRGDTPAPHPAGEPARNGAHEQDALPTRWGELILFEEIGRGSFSTVYRAHDPRLDRSVALKLLRPSSDNEHLASALLHEGRTLARVKHPNVVTVYGAGEHEGQAGLWMELVNGVTLEHMLASHGPFSAGEAGLIGQDLCRALVAVRRAGLIHGDVKAQNVMREQGGRLVLMDFGAGRMRSTEGPAPREILGTLAYLAPELLEGANPTTRSDIYSLGVLLYHLVTNDFPVRAASVTELRGAHARGEAARLRDLRSDLPATFVRVVERAIERDPARRFSSAGEMEAALASTHGSSETVRATRSTKTSSRTKTPAATVAPAFPKPGETLGRYQILDQIGAGGTGVVYRATDKRLKREVAVKVLAEPFGSDPERLARLAQEAQAIAALSHPNILTLHDVGTERGLWFTVTELLHGQTLRARMKHGPLPEGEAIEYAIDVAHGLAAAHAKDIVHMDLKPENIMVTDDGWVKILDFGVAKVGSPSPSGDDQTTRTDRPQFAGGTIPYMSPEQVCGERVDQRSDLFALGTIMYEMLAGRHPFHGQSSVDTVAAILRDDPPPIASINPAVSAGLDRIVRRSLKKLPADRFQSAREIRFALEAVRDSRHQIDTTAGTLDVARRDMPSVAVLPFSDMSPDRDQECFCDGIAEELIAALTEVPGLRVAARTSAFQFKGQTRDARQIGQVLNVGTVLDGSVRTHKNRVRITVELVGTGDGYQLWSKRFDREMADVFEVQDEIAASVVKTLQGQLATNVPVVAPHTRDLDAYTIYLEGRYHWNKRTEEELETSVECFRGAIERDPAYAVAYAGMADAYVTLGTYGARPPIEVMSSAKAALEKALELDPALAEAYACRGCLRSVFDWSWAAGERDFLRAIELNPSYPTAHHWYAINHLVPLARFQAAAAELQRARHLDPLALAIRTTVGMTAYFAEDYNSAVRELLRTIQLDEGFGMARAFLAAAYIEQGRYDDARVEMEVALRLCGRTPEILATLGYLHGRAGDVTAARGVLGELQRLAKERYVSPGRVAQVHAGLGEVNEALERLEMATAEHAADVAWLAVRPVFASLRGEPRFVSLLEQMGLQTTNSADQG